MNHILLIIGMALEALSIWVLVSSVLPRALWESRVPNGLGKLRRSIYVGILWYTVLNIWMLLIGLLYFVGADPIFVLGLGGLIFGFKTLLVAVILHYIYALDYGREKG